MSMMKSPLIFIGAIAVAAGVAQAQSPPAQTSVTLDGKQVSIKYSAPSVRGRKIFGAGGLLSQDPTYPAWRAGANSATALHTDVDLDIGGLRVSKGDYTLYAWIADPDNWQLIVSKETGQWGLSYNAKMDLGRVKMTMSKPPASIETYKITLSSSGPKTGKLQLEWDNHVASVPIAVK
jgi:hypothetical protein